MIPFPYVLRRRMMVSGGGSKDMASLAPASGITYTSGLSGLSAAEVSAMSALISNEPTITKDARTVYVDLGDLHRKFDIANQVTLSLNGTNYVFDIIGFNHDTLTTATAYGAATATGKAGITLQMHDSYATAYPMNKDVFSNKSWSTCTMRTSTLATLKGYLPSAWQSIIMPVDKAFCVGAGLTTIDTVSDSCFLLAEIEVFGSITYSASGEGSQYAYYKAGNSKIKTRNGSAYNWTLRSPYAARSAEWCRVSPAGAANYGDPTGNRGVAFAFCV